RDARCIEQIFNAARNPVQRSAIFSRGDLLISFLRLRKREIRSQCDHTAEFRIKLLQPLEVNLRETFRGDLLALDPARKVRDRSEGDVFVFGRQWTWIGFCADEL